jgi:hypothetical protein
MGCTSDVNNNPSGASESAGAGGPVGGPHDSCNGRAPNGYCNAKGGDPEDCSCVDCQSAAFCTNKCVDGDGCKMGEGGEDCSCGDCYFKVEGCPPESVGCDNNEEERAGCSLYSDDCTCGVCADDARCKGKCDNNGSCLPYLEPCSCADCANHEACGGSGSSASSTAQASSSQAASSTSGAGGGRRGRRRGGRRRRGRRRRSRRQLSRDGGAPIKFYSASFKDSRERVPGTMKGIP